MTRRHRILFLRTASSQGLPVLPERDWRWVVAGSSVEARQRLAKQEVSAVVVEMPCSRECVATLNSATSGVPILLLAELGELAAAVDLVEQGATIVVPRDPEGVCWRLLSVLMERYLDHSRAERRRSLDATGDGVVASSVVDRCAVSGSAPDRGELLLRTQHLDCLSSLARGITHSLNNVFAPILMATDLLRPRLTRAADREVLASVEQSVRRGTELVRQVLGFSRAVEGEQGRLEVRHLIRSLSQVVRDTSSGDVEVITAYPEDLWLVVADAAGIFQALIGLCLRGREELIDGGTIRIDASNIQVTQGDAGEAGREPGPYVCVTVAALRPDAEVPPGDNSGVRAGVRAGDSSGDNLAAASRPEKQTGLALAAAAAIAEAHGGWLVASRWAEQGTVVRFGLPALIEPREQEPVATVRAGDVDTGVVLIVDEDEGSRMAAQRVLKAAGFRTEVVGEFSAVTEWLREKEAVVMVLDIGHSPRRARELAERLSREHPRLWLITTDGRPPETIHDEELPQAHSRLAKPFSSSRLLRAVASGFAAR